MITLRGLNLAFGERTLFRGVSLRIADDARLCVVGSNGAGKTTLLRVLMGEVEPDGGDIERSKGLTVGYLPQDLVELEPVPLMALLKTRVGLSTLEASLRRLEEEIASGAAPRLPSLLEQHARLEHRFEQLGGFAFEAMALKVLRGLGFHRGDEGRNCAEFSGGWKMRVAMAALLLSAPDVLLLDEPTNHLDTESMEWLEGWLRGHKGAIVAVSHDRRFLENTATQIADLERGTLTLYPCGYDRYLVEKQAAQEHREKAAEVQQREIRKLEDFVDRFRYKASKAAQVQSRLKRLEKMEVIVLDGPSRDVKFCIPEAPASGWEVLKATDLSKRYGELEVFSGLNFTLNRGERAALVGVNGAGKSTLLRLLSGTEPPTSGALKLGHNVKAAFYSQESAQNLDYARTIWEEARAAPSRLNDVERRGLLGAFLFSGKDIDKPISVLSGGEKARLALYKLMLEETNLLILDEPTNHLDFTTRDVVQRALLRYQGTLLIVSHDRHFLDALAERVLELREGRLYDYPGNYSWFLEKREEAGENFPQREPKNTPPVGIRRQPPHRGGQNTGNLKPPKAPSVRELSRPTGVTEGVLLAPLRERVALREKRRELQALRAAAKRELKPAEERVERLEARRAEIDEALCSPEVLADSARVRDFMVERGAVEKELQQAYEGWERLSLRLEEVEGQLSFCSEGGG